MGKLLEGQLHAIVSSKTLVYQRICGKSPLLIDYGIGLISSAFDRNIEKMLIISFYFHSQVRCQGAIIAQHKMM